MGSRSAGTLQPLCGPERQCRSSTSGWSGGLQTRVVLRRSGRRTVWNRFADASNLRVRMQPLKRRGVCGEGSGVSTSGLLSQVRLVQPKFAQNRFEDLDHPVGSPIVGSLPGLPPALVSGLVPNPVQQPCSNPTRTEPNGAEECRRQENEKRLI